MYSPHQYTAERASLNNTNSTTGEELVLFKDQSFSTFTMNSENIFPIANDAIIITINIKNPDIHIF